MVKFLELMGAGFIAALAVAIPAKAEQLSTRNLMEFCSSNDPSLKSTCRFFILGVVEGVTAADGTTMRGKQFIEGTKTLICLPDGVTTATR
jgi:hypothetical protein